MTAYFTKPKINICLFIWCTSEEFDLHLIGGIIPNMPYINIQKETHFGTPLKNRINSPKILKKNNTTVSGYIIFPVDTEVGMMIKKKKLKTGQFIWIQKQRLEHKRMYRTRCLVVSIRKERLRDLYKMRLQETEDFQPKQKFFLK